MITKKKNILKKIQVATSTKFKKKIIYLKNPYYKRDTSKKNFKNLKKINFNKILYKKFVDIINNEYSLYNLWEVSKV